MVLFEVTEDIKTLRETLCVAQSLINQSVWDGSKKASRSAQLQRLINECDHHRPLGINGKHGNLHTETCGCEDKGPTWTWGTKKVI